MFTKVITFLILCFAAGAMLSHAIHQPIFNELYRLEAGVWSYRENAIVGWIKMDETTKQLYFEGK